MITINYPKQFIDPKTREGKKFKYYKVEPYEIDKKPEKPEEPKIKIGEGSNRIAYTKNNNKFVNEMYDLISFSDIIDSVIEEYSDESKD